MGSTNEQLQELVDKIKRDGVAVAEKKASSIIKEATEKANAIIAEAENQAEASIKRAEAEADRFRKASEASIEQASRNTLIAFEQGVVRELEAVINSETAKAYDADTLKTLIPETVKLWVKNNKTDDLAVILAPKDLKTLETSLLAALNGVVSKGVVIKADDKMSGGFKISTNNGAAYYDFSQEAVADLFASYLSPKTAEILKNASKGK